DLLDVPAGSLFRPRAREHAAIVATLVGLCWRAANRARGDGDDVETIRVGFRRGPSIEYASRGAAGFGPARRLVPGGGSSTRSVAARASRRAPTAYADAVGLSEPDGRMSWWSTWRERYCNSRSQVGPTCEATLPRPLS